MDPDHFIFSRSIATLERKAAHTVALRIWRLYTSQSEISNDDLLHYVYTPCSHDGFPTECDASVKSLRTPRPIEDMLMKALRNIQTEVKGWICSFECVVFWGRCLKEYLYRVRRTDADCCVWSPNCELDRAKSASNLLSAAELSEAQKFVIMCKYCLVDRITQFSLQSIDLNILTPWQESVLLRYWIRKLTNQQFEIIGNDLNAIKMMFDDTNVSIEVILAVYCRENDEFGFEYFWNLLNADEQVAAASHILLREKGDGLLKFLSKMSTSLQIQLVCTLPEIMKRFIVWLTMPQEAFSFWTLAKDFMTEEQFHALVFELLKVRKDDRLGRGPQLFVTGREHRLFYSGLLSRRTSKHETATDPAEGCHALLVRIWDTTPDGLRNHVLKVTFGSIVEEFFHESHKHSESGLKFLLGILSFKSADFRRMFLLENAIEFATKVPMPVFESRFTTGIIESCLPESEDRLKFQRVIMTSELLRRSYGNLLLDGEIRYLDVKLKMILNNDIVAIRELKKRILTGRSDYLKFFIVGIRNWTRLAQFIEEAYEDEPSLASTFKQNLFVDFARSDCMQSWLVRNQLDGIIEVVEHELSHEGVAIFKKAAVDGLREAVQSARRTFGVYFKTENFLKNLFWCLGNEHEVREFINGVPARMLLNQCNYGLW